MAQRWVKVMAIAIVALATTGYALEVADKDLSANSEMVVDYLVKDWKKRFRSTSIPLAMSNLGIMPNDDLRLEIVNHFRDNPRVARNVRYWGANNYLLNHDEKLIAKYLLNTYRDEERLPDLKELREQVGLSASALEQRLAFMARGEFLIAAPNEDLGFALANGAEMWGGPLRHNYHTVTVEGEKPFDVW